MEVAEHLVHLEDASHRLGDAAARTGLDAAVPTCPDWTVRDLLQHIGGVHRWATIHVRDRPTEMIRTPREELVGGWPADADLLGWYREGHQALLHELRTAPADLTCATFLPAPSPLAMWARRQAHETTIHRVDAELVGGQASPVDTALATDGIDELLAALIPHRKRRWGWVRPAAVLVDPSDADDAWAVQVSEAAVLTSRTGSGGSDGAAAPPADVHVRGPAAALYLLLWNRADRRVLADQGLLEVAGDVDLLDEWRERVRIGRR